MTADDFVEKWKDVELSERAASQEHFIDLCRLIDQPTPAEADPTGTDYCFEKAVKVTMAASKGSKGEGGFVDVWKRGCFAWEYKRKGKYKSLDEAYRQLYQYRDALDNPPLSVVCDIKRIEIRSHFPGYPTEITAVRLEELPGKLEVIRRVFRNPETFRPAKKTEEVTLDLAHEFGKLADRLIERYPPNDLTLFQSAGDPVAHFLMKVMFCLFAEDIKLLPDQAFTKIVQKSQTDPDKFADRCGNLLAKMRTGGEYGSDDIPYFNGGLFDDKPPLPLTAGDLTILRWVAERDWSGVEPSIFGTLFERLLDPRKRAQIGAHYTSKSDILLVIEPVIMMPLRREWKELQDKLAESLAKYANESDPKKRDVYAGPIKVALDQFRRHLGSLRVLDPACGSGNFLYVALQQLLDLDDEIVRFAALREISINSLPYIRPSQLHGIEINPYAAELAQVVIWIGYLQWLNVHGIGDPKRPILDNLQSIENRDAILDLRDERNPTPAVWPKAEFIVGNPPFLGFAVFRKNGLDDAYISALQASFEISRKADLCSYWFVLAMDAVASTKSTRVGLLATQAIRSASNRQVLQRIDQKGNIFYAWRNRPWVLDGANVRVSIVAFDAGFEQQMQLDGLPTRGINADLSPGEDFTAAMRLDANASIAFEGDQKGGPFELTWSDAREMLREPNATGDSNAEVVKRTNNASDLVGRDPGGWIIDFGLARTQAEAAAFEAPWKRAEAVVRPARASNRQAGLKERWWIHKCPRPELRAATTGLTRCLVTPRVSKHRVFRWLDASVLPDSRLFVFARDDEYFFGILQSAIHELWSLRLGARHGDGGADEDGGRPTYNGTSCFETFPFPWKQVDKPQDRAYLERVARASKKLHELRERWLNPAEWLEPLAAKIDAADDFTDVPADARPLIRQSAIMAAAAKDARLKKRTLTNLYNERPTWLKLAHEALDRAVLAAYAATDPEGDWSEDWAAVWTETGAGQPLPKEHPLVAERARVDQALDELVLQLDLDSVSPQLSAELLAIAGQPQILKYRSLFQPVVSISETTDFFHVFSLTEHFEDENSNAVSIADVMDMLSGQTGGVVLGDVDSILRHGPLSIQRAERWSIEKANTLSHFLEVTSYLVQSHWIRSRVRYSQWIGADGKAIGPPFNFSRPNLSTLSSVLSLIRQLHTDELFYNACRLFLEHVGSDARRIFIEYERDLFTESLKTVNGFPSPGVDGRTLIELFLYGFGLMHRKKPAPVEGFRELIARVGAEVCVAAFHSHLKLLVDHSYRTAAVIDQNMRHWIAAEGAVAPTRASFFDILEKPGVVVAEPSASHGLSLVTFEI